jgi:hypothetical protein
VNGNTGSVGDMTIRSRIRHEVTRAGNVLDSTASKGADALADVIETVGNAAGDGLHRLGRGLPVGGPIVFWVGGIASAAADFIGSVAKGIGAVLGGMLSGAIRLVGALSILEPRMTIDGLRALALGVTGGLVLVLGKAVALVQVALGIGRTRPLTDEEGEAVGHPSLSSTKPAGASAAGESTGRLWRTRPPGFRSRASRGGCPPSSRDPLTEGSQGRTAVLEGQPELAVAENRSARRISSRTVTVVAASEIGGPSAIASTVSW